MREWQLQEAYSTHGVHTFRHDVQEASCSNQVAGHSSDALSQVFHPSMVRHSSCSDIQIEPDPNDVDESRSNFVEQSTIY